MKPDVAVIDIGSNSVRLMLGTTDNGRVRSVEKTLRMTRLARGIDASHRLADDRIEETVQAIDLFRKKAESFGIPVIAYATSAVRDALNRDSFCSLVKEKTGIGICVLSGEEEGRFAFSAVTGGEGTVFDIGGGSFQIVTRNSSVSFPCGCVRAKDQCDASDPDKLYEALSAWLSGHSDVPGSVPGPVYGVGGTITTIGALLAMQTVFDDARLEPITLSKLDDLIVRLAKLPEPIRMQHPLLTKRGDVILQGASILKYLMQTTGTNCVIPSDRDGTEGIAEAFLNGELTDRIRSDGGKSNEE